VKEGAVASGYEKDACGVDPNRGWDQKPRRPRVQALIDCAILACALLVYATVLFAVVRFMLG
jgi:hypothetical protein